MFIKNSKVYDALKWLALLVLPNCATAYSRLAQVWGLPYPDEIPETVMIICGLIGAILGISNATYYKLNARQGYTDFTEELEPNEDNTDEGIG